MDWLLQGCDSDLSAAFLSFGAGVFPLDFLKVQDHFFFCFGAEIWFWSYNFDDAARSSIALCNPASADGSVLAASRLFGAAAACVILLSFAAGPRKSYWSGSIKVANSNLSANFLNFGAGDFPF